MDPAHLTPDRLRSFRSAALHRSFTRAAEVLHLSQSAVSRQIAELERTLGVPLFHRRGRRLALTDAGRAFLPEAERVLGDLERAQEVVRVATHRPAPRLRIGASTTPGFYLLPSVLARFHARRPDVEIAYVVANSRAIEERLLRGELDVGLVGAAPADERLVAEPLVEDEIVCFARRTHRLAGRRREVAPRELADELVVTREPGSATRRLLESWLAAAGAVAPRSLELNCPEAIKAVVSEGLGLGFASGFGLRRGVRPGRLRIVPIAAPPLRRRILLLRAPETPPGPTLQEFLEVLRRSPFPAPRARN
jgi:DNA-binding transcriptional LysR family regulator